ncbi:MAG: maltose acetyltransferase [Herbinix sp.]|jgi:maltose O-acetyltransferase|nr:maltose acetyltransferase [Herbinix sp.]
MTEKELMLSEQLYIAKDDEIKADMMKARELTRLINSTTENQPEYRIQLFKELFQKIGDTFWIETPFRCDFGCNISIGDDFFANFDCIILDVCDVTIGNNVFFGPRVSIFTAAHPIDAQTRNSMLEYGKKVSIGNSVWIGGNTVINPGVKIEDNVVIGSGSIVTKDIPSNVIAVGNPCKVLRPITEKDKQHWSSLAEAYQNNHDKI